MTAGLFSATLSGWARHAHGRLPNNAPTPMKVRFGVGLGTQGLADPSQYQPIIRDLERLGFDSIWLPERVAGAALDPVVGLSIAAGWTTRLKLGTGVIVLPGRN